MRRSIVGGGLMLAAAACSPAPDDDRALAADQEARLNAAAEMLDANSVALEEVTNNGTDDDAAR